MSMFLLEARLVVVLIAAIMHEIELVDETAGLEHLERAIHRNPIQLRVLLLGHLKETLGIQVLAGLIDQFKQDLPLAGETNPALFQRTFDGVKSHSGDSPILAIPRPS